MPNKYFTQENVEKIKAKCETVEDEITVTELARTGMNINDLKKIKGKPPAHPFL